MATIRNAFNSDLFYSTEPLQLVSNEPEITDSSSQKSHGFFIGAHSKPLPVIAVRDVEECPADNRNDSRISDDSGSTHIKATRPLVHVAVKL